MTEFWKRPISRILLAAGTIAALILAISALDASSPGESAEGGSLVCETDSQSVSSPLFESIMPDMALRTLGSGPVMLHDLAGEHLTAIVTCSYRCPCSDGYNGRLKALRKSYEPKGVAFVALHANADETADGMKSYVNRKAYPLEVYRDVGAVCADALSAAVTPEVFVFTPDWRLQYHGRIDDDKGGLFITEETLKNALDTLLTRKPLMYREKMAMGCAIVRKLPS